MFYPSCVRTADVDRACCSNVFMIITSLVALCYISCYMSNRLEQDSIVCRMKSVAHATQTTNAWIAYEHACAGNGINIRPQRNRQSFRNAVNPMCSQPAGQHPVSCDAAVGASCHKTNKSQVFAKHYNFPPSRATRCGTLVSACTHPNVHLYAPARTHTYVHVYTCTPLTIHEPMHIHVRLCTHMHIVVCIRTSPARPQARANARVIENKRCCATGRVYRCVVRCVFVRMPVRTIPFYGEVCTMWDMYTTKNCCSNLDLFNTASFGPTEIANVGHAILNNKK